ncbi:hypothetical protein ACFLQN_03645 [Candidatus Aenigmatarchaeota archaeon]
MLTPMEEKILKNVSKFQLLTKIELKRRLRENGTTSNGNVVDIAIRNLSEKDLISLVTPIGSTCLVLTKRGSKLLEDLEL